jgi:hypothetical protein
MQPSRADSSVTGKDTGHGADASAGAPASDRKTCTQNGDCAEEEFCEKALCDVSFPGTCQLRPGQTSAAPCSLTRADLPVCGCDGMDYSAACVAYTQGVNVSYYGPLRRRARGQDVCGAAPLIAERTRGNAANGRYADYIAPSTHACFAYPQLIP